MISLHLICCTHNIYTTTHSWKVCKTFLFEAPREWLHFIQLYRHLEEIKYLFAGFFFFFNLTSHFAFHIECYWILLLLIDFIVRIGRQCLKYLIWGTSMHSFIELACKLINIVKRFWVCLYIASDKGMWCFGAVYMHEHACERQMNEAVGCILPVFLLRWKCATAASVEFSLSVVSESLRPPGPQHARLPVHHQLLELAHSCPSSRWCHPTISSSFILFFSSLHSVPASGSFTMSQFFPSGGQNFGASASASVLPMNIQDRFPLGLTGWISLQSKGLSKVFSNTTVQKHQCCLSRWIKNLNLFGCCYVFWKSLCIISFCFILLFTIIDEI